MGILWPDMKVLVVNTNREKSPQTLVPLGACLVASAAEDAGHDVHLLDLCFERNPVRAMEAAARRLAPDVIGLSIRNLDNCDYTSPQSYLPEISEIVRACRRACGAMVVVGGSAVGQAPEAVRRLVGADVAVGGEGERAFVDLLEGETSPRPSPRGEGVERWLDLGRYAAYEAAMPVQTKRGCALKCSYCCYPLLEGSRWRLREPAQVADEVRRASAMGLRMVEFVDSVFGLPQEHAVACCEEIAREGHVPLGTMDLNPLACTSELVEAMNAAGFTAVGVSAESGSDQMLESLGKGYSASELFGAVERARRLKARRMWMFMVGAPRETEATVTETARFIESLPREDLVMVTYGVRVLPRTTLRERLVAEGVIDPEDGLVQPTFFFSPQLTLERAREIIGGTSFPAANMVSLGDGGHKLIPLVQRIASALGARPPYWRHLPFLNRARRILRI